MKLVLMSVFFTITAWSGQDVGNGGDAIICRKSSSNYFEGYYSLDYVLTWDGKKRGVATAQTWDESLGRIEKLLKEKVPALYVSFREFRKLVLNRDHSKERAWEATPFELVDIKDEKIVVRLPDNCLVNGKPKLVQAVIRQKKKHAGSRVQIYRYMKPVFDKLQATRPTQLSFLIVHEWLWDFSDNAEQIRRINRLFHSADFEHLDPVQVAGRLNGMGLKIDFPYFLVTRDLGKMLDFAPSGSTLWITDDLRFNTLRIQKPVRIRSVAGRNLRGRFEVRSDGVKLENFNLVHAGQVKPLLDLQAGNTEITQVRFSGTGKGIALRVGPNARLISKKTRFEAFESAVEIVDGGNAKFENVSLNKNGQGIRVSGLASLAIFIGKISNTAGAGISIVNTTKGSAQVVVIRTEIKDSEVGIQYEGNGYFRCLNCTISFNRGIGLFMGAGVHGSLRNSRILNNGAHGIHLKSKRGWDVTHNTIGGNQGYGLLYPKDRGRFAHYSNKYNSNLLGDIHEE